jgi:hypothetical protein
MISIAKVGAALLLATLVTALSSCTPEQPAQPEQPEPGTEALFETADEKTFYAMGATMARNLDRLPLSESEKEALRGRRFWPKLPRRRAPSGATPAW